MFQTTLITVLPLTRSFGLTWIFSFCDFSGPLLEYPIVFISDSPSHGSQEDPPVPVLFENFFQ